MHEAGPPQSAHLSGCHPELGAGLLCEFGYGTGVPERVGGLQVDEVGHGQQRVVEFFT